MNALARAGWLLCAAFFAVLLSSIFHVPFVPPVAGMLLFVLAAIAVFFPTAAVSVVVLLAPVIGVLAAREVPGTVSWPEALACAAVTGLSLRAAYVPRPAPPLLAAPALIFTCLVIASGVASLGVVALRLGPSFFDALIGHFTREHFVDLRGFPTITISIRLLEGVLLFVLTARLALPAHRLKWVLAATVVGGTLAAAMNIGRLFQVAARTGPLWSSVVDLSQRLRWNVHYSDINAAGSYFLLVLFFAAALVASSRRIRRLLWMPFVILIGGALWLTSSRVAFLAGLLAGAVAIALPHFVGRARLVRAATTLLVALALVVGLAIALPHREGQVSAIVAADVRFGMARTGARMIRSHPAFGVGLGEFTERAAEFTEPELIAKMPAAAHENAHNYFIQIAAELGLTGGIAFVWLVGAALFASMRVQSEANHREPWHTLAGAGLLAFVLTWLGGHPLLVAEPAFVFWTTFGAVAGMRATDPSTVRTRWWVAAVCLAILVSLPWRMQSMMRNADLEHVGIGVSSNWRTAPDGTRYREAKGTATLFVPTAGFKLSVNPQSSAPVRLELKLDGRVADIVSLSPSAWNDISFPARTERATSKSARLDLRVLDADGIVIWITKDQPIQ